MYIFRAAILLTISGATIPPVVEENIAEKVQLSCYNPTQMFHSMLVFHKHYALSFSSHCKLYITILYAKWFAPSPSPILSLGCHFYTTFALVSFLAP